MAESRICKMMRTSQQAHEDIFRSNLGIISGRRCVQEIVTYVYEEECTDTQTWQSQAVANLLQQDTCRSKRW